MKTRQSILGLFCLALFCSPSIAGEASADTDAIMAKIYSAGNGTWEGYFHNRSISQNTDWKTEPTRYTCKTTAALALTCEGTDNGKDNWVSKFRVESGMEYQDATPENDEPWSRAYRITDAWYTDDDNNGGTREWQTTAKNGMKFEGIDTIVQMGDRFVVIRKLRRQGSSDRFQYNMIHEVTRVR